MGHSVSAVLGCPGPGGSVPGVREYYEIGVKGADFLVNWGQTTSDIPIETHGSRTGFMDWPRFVAQETGSVDEPESAYERPGLFVSGFGIRKEICNEKVIEYLVSFSGFRFVWLGGL